MTAVYGAPPVDFLPQQDPVAYDHLVKSVESFIATRFLPVLNSLRLQPVVHIVKVILIVVLEQSCQLLCILCYRLGCVMRSTTGT
jgi:hypothetical protein